MDDGLLISGFGDWDSGGGLLSVDGGSVERLDWIASTGIASSPDRRQVARVARTSDEATLPGELLLYDESGVLSYRRVDGLADAHDVLWHDELLVVASPLNNSLLWLEESGKIVERWCPPGAAGDASHLNCLLVSDGRLLACAFGEFRRHRQWAKEATAGAGFVFDVRSGRRVLEGLSHPHHPRRLDERWIICESSRRRVVAFDDRGRRLEELDLGQFTRGIAFDEQWIYVGCSANRHIVGDPQTASLAVLDRRTLQIAERIPLPTREVYDVLLVPPALVLGLRRGFRVNPMRIADRDRLATLRAMGAAPDPLWREDPLPPESCRSSLHIDLPATPIRANDALLLPYAVCNRGDALLISAPPDPVMLSWRWFTADGSALVAEGDRIALPEPLEPGTSTSGTFWLRSPPESGRYLLRASLVQEGVHWFDDIDRRSGFTSLLDVRAA